MLKKIDIHCTSLYTYWILHNITHTFHYSPEPFFFKTIINLVGFLVSKWLRLNFAQLTKWQSGPLEPQWLHPCSPKEVLCYQQFSPWQPKWEPVEPVISADVSWGYFLFLESSPPHVQMRQKQHTLNFPEPRFDPSTFWAFLRSCDFSPVAPNPRSQSQSWFRCARNPGWFLNLNLSDG